MAQMCCVFSRVRLFVDCSPPGTFVHGIFPGKNTGVGSHFFSRMAQTLKVQRDGGQSQPPPLSDPQPLMATVLILK